MLQLKKIITFSFIVICVLNVIFIPAFSQIDSKGLVVTPSINSVDLDKGKTYSYKVNLENSSTENNLNIDVSFETFVAGSEEGLPQIVPFNDSNKEKDWITAHTENFVLNAAQIRSVDIDLSIPQEAEAGGYYFAVVFTKSTQASNNAQLILNQRLVSLLFVNIKGDVGREVNFSNFKTEQYIYDPFFDFLNVKADINLKGRSYYKPTGVIWAYQNNTTPFSSLPLNQNNRIILPNSTRSFQALSKPIWNISWFSNAGAKYEELNKAQDTDFKRPWFGKVQLVANANYLSSNDGLEVAQAKTEIIFLPWKLTLLLLLILGILILLMYLAKRFRSKASTNTKNI